VPKVTVVIATYNCAPYIAECIGSIVEQSWRDWEAVVCDDASTDDTWPIVTSLARRDARIRLLRNQERLGAAATRNRCIEASLGDYVAIQDADDVSLKHRLECEVSYLDERPEVPFVSGGLFLFDDQGIYGLRVLKKLSPADREFLMGIPYCHASTMFRRGALWSVNGYRVAAETFRGQDLDLFMRLHSKGMRGHNLPCVVYAYRQGREAFERKAMRYRLAGALIRF